MTDFTLWQMWGHLALAARWTVLLSLVAFVGGSILGLALLTLRLSGLRGVKPALQVYVQVFQGTPLLMQLFLAYFGLSLCGLDVPAWLAAGLALTLYSAAYLTEIWRGCVEAVPKGQWEAADSLALSFMQKLRHVVLPQALRVAVAPTVGFLVQVVKGTALASVIGFVELTKAGGMIANATFQPFEAYGLVALTYFILCFPVSMLSRGLERKLHAQH